MGRAKNKKTNSIPSYKSWTRIILYSLELVTVWSYAICLPFLSGGHGRESAFPFWAMFCIFVSATALVLYNINDHTRFTAFFARAVGVFVHGWSIEVALSGNLTPLLFEKWTQYTFAGVVMVYGGFFILAIIDFIILSRTRWAMRNNQTLPS